MIDTILGMDILWSLNTAHMVRFDVYNKTNDTGASKPNVNVYINGNPVCSSNSSNGLTVSTVHHNTVVNILPDNYTIEYGEEVEISTDAAGSNNDAADLTMSMTFILE